MAGKKSEYRVKLDEAMFGLHDTIGIRKICCAKRNSQIPEYWVNDIDTFFNTFMAVVAIRALEPLQPLRTLTTTNAIVHYYIGKVLRPVLEVPLGQAKPCLNIKG